MAMELQDKLYTSTQVADILGVSLRTLYRYMEDNKIGSMRTASGRHRFTKDQIIDFLNAGQGSSTSGVQSPSSAQGQQSQPQPQPSQQYQQGGGFDTPGQQAQAPQAEVESFSQTQVTEFQTETSAPVQSQNPFATSQQQHQPVDLSDDETDDTEDDGILDFTDDEEDELLDTIQEGFRADNLSSAETQQQQSNDGQAQSSPQSDNSNVAEQPAGPQAPEADETAGFAQSERGTSDQPVQAQQSQPVQSQSAQSSQFGQAPVATSNEPSDEEIDFSASMNIRYYKSDFTDLIDLAKKIKETATSKDLEYAFTLFAGLSLHFLIKPFTMLHIYANPEDMQIWKDELRLVPSQRKEDSNLGVVINTDIIFVPSKDIGGFKVVEDRVLMKDLAGIKEEDLVKQFRQHLTSS